MSARDALWASGYDESVEVNQRALIDKILARYSAEHTVFRELLQNADDAHSKTVEIHFKSFTEEGTSVASSSLPDLENINVKKWVFKNDGEVFRPEDWNRLKKIAEGNPDESKIGAFGVGFYSLFSITESPFVSSGPSWMQFYWKDGKDALFVRRGTLPDNEAANNKWTSFEMELREPQPMPSKPLDLARFLATSITFMNSITQVSVFFDSRRLFTISKVVGLSEKVPMLPKLKRASQYMTMDSVSSKSVVITASVMRWIYAIGSDSVAAQANAVAAKNNETKSFFGFFKSAFAVAAAPPVPLLSRLERLTDAEKLEVLDLSVQLVIYSAEVVVKLPSKTANEIERATKKKVPARLPYQIVYTDKAGYDASVKEDAKMDFTDISVFDGVRADLDGGKAKMFIGHTTAQTTGVGGHHASRFIPTVEREALDLVDPVVSRFNKELLSIGGFLSRLIYEQELAQIGQDWARITSASAVTDPSELTSLEDRFSHILRFFAFHPSTPSPQISHLMKEAFLNDTVRTGLPLLTTAGVKSSADARLYDEELNGFLKAVPFLSPKISSHAAKLLSPSTHEGFLHSVYAADILRDLENHTLNEGEMVKCLRWRLGLTPSLIPAEAKASLTGGLLSAATLATTSGPGTKETVVSLGQIKTYVAAGGHIPADTPLPSHTLPMAISEKLRADLLSSTFSWQPLSLLLWLQNLIQNEKSLSDGYRITASPDFARRILEQLASSWNEISQMDQRQIKELLTPIACIPTNLGMKTPNDSYFPNVDMFPVPIVDWAKGTSKVQEMLKGFGVRNHIELQIIFTKLIASGQWSIPELIKYFVSLKDDLSLAERDKLKKTKMFFSAALPGTARGQERYLASELHEPTPEHTELGLRVLDWNDSSWNPKSPEGQFVSSLGLLKYPSLDTLINLASTGNGLSLQILLSNFHARYESKFSLSKYGNIQFIPGLLPGMSEKKLFEPGNVYSHPDCACMGFAVVSPEFRSEARRVKVEEHPAPSRLVSQLSKLPPKTQASAKEIFEYLAGRVPNFGSAELATLKDLKFIPQSSGTKLMKPAECFIGKPGAVHSALFIFVDFGDRANNFLAACGVRPEPSPQQVVETLLADPQSFFNVVGGTVMYLDELRQIAVNVRRGQIDRGAQARMRKASIFLANKIIPITSTAAHDDDDDAQTKEESRLMPPSEICIVDDVVTFRLFRESVWAAPQEDALEEFYAVFGARAISALVQERHQPSGEGFNPQVATEIRQLVLERLPLFLHDRSHTTTKTAFKFQWLKDNFVVTSVKSLMVQSTLGLRPPISKSRSASAACSWTGKGPVVLFIGPSGRDKKPDLVEVAHALCQVMFSQHSGTSSLLLSTILSTDLRALKRIGYDVDRIIRQQKSDAEQRKLEQAAMERNVLPKPVAPLPTSRDPEKPISATDSQTTTRPPSIMPPSSSRFDSFKNKLLPQRPSLPGVPVIRSSGVPNGKPKQQNSNHITPDKDIERNMQVALDACRKEHSSRIDSRNQMTMVPETQNGGYCDESANANIALASTVDGFQVWLSKGLDEHLVHEHGSAIQRFARVLAVLRDQVYKILPSSLCIFYDTEGPLIAFNRSGSLFVNLRYYLALHDAKLKANASDWDDSLLYWFFVLAHEIAHNLVSVHNSEHSYYLSVLAEKHVKQLALFLSATT